MALIGEGFRGGLFDGRLVPTNPAGLLIAIVGAIAMFIGNQMVLGLGAVVVKLAVIGGKTDDMQSFVVASLLMLLPAAIPVVMAAWWLAGRRHGNPSAVLNLGDPKLGQAGWAILVGAFFIIMFLVGIVAFNLSGAGNGGAVEEALSSVAQDPRLFALALPSVVLGAPIAEELIFRGQLYTALSQTRLGFSGASLITAGLWSGAHFSEGRLAVAIIFFMGLVFGWMLYRFGSLRVTFVCHAMWNLANSLILLGASQQ
jgi:membrane protease YdiL (CAAX protease family)